jgi:suppressor for copper-sensitivity B
MTPTRNQRLSSALAALLLGVLGMAGAGTARAASSAWQENPQSRVRLITPYQTAPRQGELRLGLQFKLSPGWHVYWKNSGDAGFAPVVTFDKNGLNAGINQAELLWPPPHRFDLPGNLVAFGYEDEVVYPVRATAQATGDRLEIAATLDYLVCEVDCVPYRYDLRLSQPLGDSAVPDPATAPLIERAWASLPVTADRLPGVSTRGTIEPGPEGSALLKVWVAGAEAAPAPDGPQLFLEAHEQFDADRPRHRQEGKELLFFVPLRPRQVDQELPASTPFAWTVTGLRHAGRPVSLEARQDVPRQDLEAAPPVAPGHLPSMLLLAFLGGLLLNLTPSVLALLVPAWLELRTAPSRSAPAAVAAGILALSWGTAFLATAAHRAGWPAGWGSQLQEPAAATLLAVAAAWVALNLWGLVGAPLARDGESKAGGGRWLLAGLLTPLLAYAWILPVLTNPVGFAADRGLAASLAVFTAVGLGLAAPYLALAVRPGDAGEPVPGPPSWSTPLREALGFAAAAGTFWLLYALARQVSPEGLAWIELALLAMALFAWLRQRLHNRAVRRTPLKFTLAAGLLVCAALALWLADRNRLTPRPTGTPAQAALQAAGEP